MACEICRPGGLDLTAELLSGIPLRHDLRVLDVGCGQGSTLNMLAKQYDIHGTGLDSDAPALRAAKEAASPDIRWIHSDFLSCSLPDASFDLILFECSYSKIDPPAAAVRLAHRLLCAGGSLLLSDLYSKAEEMTLSGSLGRLEHLESIRTTIEDAGFTVLELTDRSAVLKAYAAQMYFSKEETSLSRDLLAHRDELLLARPGYFILKAIRK